MKTLCITTRFLDGSFHGQGDFGPEWPPSPFRLFQSMLAASSRTGQMTDELFQWLERLEPPDILAPPKQRVRSWKIYVPNNDSDKKPDRQERLAEKIFSPIRILGNEPVHYLWPLKNEDQYMAEKAACQAKGISALGWGIDLVAVDGRILSPEDHDTLIKNYSGDHWRPTEGFQNRLRCPKPGSLADLKRTYASFLGRFNGNVYQPARKPVEFIEQPYAKTGTVQRTLAAFKLLRPHDDSEILASFDQRKVMEISAWVRGYLCQSSQESGFPGDSGVVVAGHVPEQDKNGRTPPRFSYLPLPSIGHKHADGRIRRFLVAGPYAGDEKQIQWARRMLTNAVVKDKDNIPMARLQPLYKYDGVIYHYVREARTFQTITPVVLPGYDDMKYAKAQKLLEKALEQAGLSVDDLAEPIYLQKAPFRNGCYHPQSYALPIYLKGKSAMHVRLKLKEPTQGPLVLGAGRHFGLGLFAPEDES